MSGTIQIMPNSSTNSSIHRDMEWVVSTNSDLIRESWATAISKGWEDIVFVWTIDGDDLRSVCMRRESVLSAFKDSETSIPSKVVSELISNIGRPAGKGKAWLVFSGDDFMSSMCIEYPNTPIDRLN